MTAERDHKHYLRDLFTLEVTTVVVDRIPEDILFDLSTRVGMLHAAMERSMGQAEADEGGAPRGSDLGGRFDAFASRMKGAEAAAPMGPDRLMAMADLLRGVPDVEAVRDMPEEKRMALRRLITVGHHPIAMHTTLSVGGDLLTLIAEDFTGDDKRPLRDAHAENIRHAVGWWRAIGEFVVTGLRFVLGALEDPSPPQPKR